MRAIRTLLFFLLLTLGLCACAQSPTHTAANTPTQAPPTQTTSPSQTLTPSLTAAITQAATSTPAPSNTPIPTGTPTASPTPTAVPTAVPTTTPIPTYVKLRGEVIADQVVCHYGPGAPYLYKYGVYKGSNLEIIARVEPGTYIEVQAIGGNNPCWVNPQWMKIKGDLVNVQPIRPEDVKLPMSPYYAPPKNVSARRDGNVVTVVWNPFVLRPGDDSEQVPYLIEAWVCKNGQIEFTPLGAYQTALKITDEPGCPVPSHGKFYAVEKHGYTRPLEIPWPAASEPPAADPTPTP